MSRGLSLVIALLFIGDAAGWLHSSLVQNAPSNSLLFFLLSCMQVHTLCVAKRSV
jgi:hypothetical protein